MKIRAVRFAIRCYESLLWLYPREFRCKHAAEMACVFGESCEAEWRARGNRGVGMLAASTLHDLIVSAAAERVFGLLPADQAMSAYIERVRAPYAAKLAQPLARTEGLLYRRGNFNGTFDELILRALMSEKDAEIAFSPGFRWGASLLPGEAITLEDVMAQTAITYPQVTLSELTGTEIKAILEDIADNLFNPDP